MRAMIDALEIVKSFVDKFSPFELIINTYNQVVLELRSPDLKDPYGFCIQIQFNLNSISLELKPDSFARDLIEEFYMSISKPAFHSIFKSVEQKGYRLKLLADKKAVELDVRHEYIHKEINSFSFSMEKLGVLHGDTDDQKNLEQFLLNAFSIFGVLFPLVQEQQEYDESVQGLPEGSISTVLVNKYERSKANRLACIAHHGYQCMVCNETMSDKYGDLGEEYIHVHHLTPVSEIGADYLVDPVSDLVPLCPNCHAMIHRMDDVSDIDGLRGLINR